MTISSHNVKQNGPSIQGNDISGKSGLDNMRGTVYISDMRWRQIRSRETKP